MAYSITGQDLETITDVEVAFSTDRLLPAPGDIPESFYEGNIYTQLAEALFYQTRLPAKNMFLHADVDPDALRRCVEAHLSSWSPKHELKIAGVGYMLSQLSQISSETSGGGEPADT